MVPRQVGGDGEKPGGKFFAGPETGAGTEDADESFLRKVVGVILVADHAAEKMEHRRRVAFHQIIERRVLAGGQSLHVRPVPGVGLPRRRLRRRSVVVMLMAGGSGHGLFGLFVEAEREALHLGQIPSALFRRHGPADFGEMLEHLRLALGAERGDFGQFLLARPD